MVNEPNLSPTTEQEASKSDQPTGQANSGSSQQGNQQQEQDQQQGKQEQQLQPRGVAGAEGAEGDIVVDIPQLAVDELTLELHAPILDQVKLEAKSLQVGLFAKINLDNVVELTGKRRASRPPDIEGQAEAAGGEEQPAAGEQPKAGVRKELRQLVESAKEAYEDVSDRDLEKQVREFYDTARHAYERVSGDAEDGGGDGDRASAEGDRGSGRERPDSAGRRALELTKQGGKAAGLTAAGVAGGAALESMRQGSVKLHMPWRSKSRPKAVVDKVRDTIG